MQQFHYYLCRREAADDRNVSGIEKLLEHTAQRDRERKQNYFAQKRAVEHIHLGGRFFLTHVFPLSCMENVAKETLINSPRADAEKICVLTTALFRRNTLCISRKSD